MNQPRHNRLPVFDVASSRRFHSLGSCLQRRTQTGAGRPHQTHHKRLEGCSGSVRPSICVSVLRSLNERGPHARKSHGRRRPKPGLYRGMQHKWDAALVTLACVLVEDNVLAARPRIVLTFKPSMQADEAACACDVWYDACDTFLNFGRPGTKGLSAGGWSFRLSRSQGKRGKRLQALESQAQGPAPRALGASQEDPGTLPVWGDEPSGQMHAWTGFPVAPSSYDVKSLSCSPVLCLILWIVLR